jgi:formylglycine-generating enzyme required for sulfatase activity
VGTKLANSAGLYDMTGNVWEWCWDWDESVSSSTPADGAIAGSLRLFRGGGWDNIASHSYVFGRARESPDYNTGSNLGFRVVCPSGS